MRKKIQNRIKCILILVLITFINQVQAQVINAYQFAHVIGGASEDQISKIETDLDGNIYVTGNYKSSSLDLNPGTPNTNHTNNGSSDIFIAKYTPEGKFVWSRAIGGVGNEVVYSISVSPSSDIYFCGSFNGTVDFDASSSVSNITSNGQEDGFIARYDSSGNFVWAGNIGGSGNDVVRDLIYDAPLNLLYGCGSFEGTADFDASSSTYNRNSKGSSDCFVLAYDFQNNFVLANTIGGTLKDEIISIGIDQNSNILIGGSFRGTVDFDFKNSVSNMTAEPNITDVFVAKYNSTFELQWHKQISPVDYVELTDLVVNQAGIICLSGKFSDSTYFSSLFHRRMSKGQQDGFVLCLFSAGNVASIQTFGTNDRFEYNQVKAIHLTNFDEILILGTTTADFDAAASSQDTFILKASSETAYLIETDIYGNFSRANLMTNGSDDSRPSCVIVDANEDVIIGGGFTGTVNFDPNFNERIQSNKYGDFDGFFAKYSKCGLFQRSNFTFEGDTTCYGKSTNLTFTAGAFGFEYSWYSDSIGGTYLGSTSFTTPQLFTATTYYLQDSGCNVYRRTPVQVFVIPEINRTITRSGDSLLAPTGNYNYQWIDCNTQMPIVGETGSALKLMKAGQFSVKITDKISGCDATSDCFQVNKLDINHIVNTHTLNVYPNPGSNFLNVYSDATEECEFVIMDTFGRILIKGVLSSETIIDISDLASGQYILKTTRNEITQFLKI